MKRIVLNEYKKGMGTFLEINNQNYSIVEGSVHVPYERLLINHKELLDKKVKYYIYCNGGVKSRKAVNILEFYGYDVTLVVKE